VANATLEAPLQITVGKEALSEKSRRRIKLQDREATGHLALTGMRETK